MYKFIFDQAKHTNHLWPEFHDLAKNLSDPKKSSVIQTAYIRADCVSRIYTSVFTNWTQNLDSVSKKKKKKEKKMQRLGFTTFGRCNQLVNSSLRTHQVLIVKQLTNKSASKHVKTFPPSASFKQNNKKETLEIEKDKFSVFKSPCIKWHTSRN